MNDFEIDLHDDFDPTGFDWTEDEAAAYAAHFDALMGVDWDALPGGPDFFPHDAEPPF